MSEFTSNTAGESSSLDLWVRGTHSIFESMFMRSSTSCTVRRADQSTTGAQCTQCLRCDAHCRRGCKGTIWNM